jgi:hypothetical protein
MSDNPTLSRRDVFKVAVAATVSLFVRSQLPGVAALQRAQQALLPVRLAGLLAHTESAKAIGSEYLRLYPQHAKIEVLLDQIASRLAASDVGLFSITDHSLREQLDGMVRADFAVDRVVKLRGWVLSATEARLCALAALM